MKSASVLPLQTPYRPIIAFCGEGRGFPQLYMLARIGVMRVAALDVVMALGVESARGSSALPSHYTSYANRTAVMELIFSVSLPRMAALVNRKPSL